MTAPLPGRLLLLVAAIAAAPCLAAEETVSVTVGGSAAFHMTNVSQPKAAGTNPTLVRFQSANLASGRCLRISVRAQNSTWTAPSGNPIAATKVTWQANGAIGGTGYSGTLSATDFQIVYQSAPNPDSGGVDINWNLGAPGSSIRAGSHNLTLEWKFESIGP